MKRRFTACVLALSLSVCCLGANASGAGLQGLPHKQVPFPASSLVALPADGLNLNFCEAEQTFGDQVALALFAAGLLVGGLYDPCRT